MSKIKKPFVVAFSGGCCSGKTTTLNALKEQLEKEGKKVLVFKADSHAYLAERNTTIDAIRRRALDYLRFQEWICHEQANFENQILQDRYYDYDVILLDRSLFDCLFYTQYYIDLGNESLQLGMGLNRYHDLQLYLDKYITKAIERIYDMILFFEPITKPAGNTATYTRPIGLDMLKYIEGFGISKIVDYYSSSNRITVSRINLNTTELPGVIQNITNVFLYYSRKAARKKVINDY